MPYMSLPRGTWSSRRPDDEPADPVAVERLRARKRGFGYGYADRAAALALEDPPEPGGGWKFTAREVAVRLGCSMRTVERHRATRIKAAATAAE